MNRTILILGGYGNAGGAVADLLFRETMARLILAGRRLEKAQELAGVLNARYGGTRASARHADAADAASVRRALDGVDMVIVASSTIDHTLAVAETALAARIDYFDVLLSSPHKLAALRSLSRKIEEAGLCFLTDGGYHPGVPAALVRYAAIRFDDLDSAVASSVMRLQWARYQFSESSVREFARELAQFQPAAFLEGKWTESWMVTRTVDFGAPFGRQRCAPMRLEEMIELPERIPTLRETGFFVAGFDPVTDYIVMPASLAVIKFLPGLALAVGRFFRWSATRFGKPPFGLVLQLDASGSHEGRKQRLLLRLAHEDGYFFTAVPVVACLRQYLDGAIRIPGLHYQATLVEPVSFLSDMKRMGLRVSEEVIDC